MQEVDFLVTPTAPMPAPRIDAETIEVQGRRQKVRGPGSGHISRNTSPMNGTGFPAITVPCGFSGLGLPIGLQFIGRPWAEGNLFRIAHAYEGISPSVGAWPDLG